MRDTVASIYRGFQGQDEQGDNLCRGPGVGGHSTIWTCGLLVFNFHYLRLLKKIVKIMLIALENAIDW